MDAAILVALIASGAAVVGTAGNTYASLRSSKTSRDSKLSETRLDYLIKKRSDLSVIYNEKTSEVEDKSDISATGEGQRLFAVRMVEEGFQNHFDKLERCCHLLPNVDYEKLRQRGAHIMFLLGLQYSGKITTEEHMKLSFDITSYPGDVNELIRKTLVTTTDDIEKIFTSNR